MSSVPVLSIVMPCHNTEKTLHRAIDSILMQQVDFPYEIIIVDDCSTDQTSAIVREYQVKNDHIHLLQHQENQGNAGAFYTGLCAAKGDYFCVLDGDDYYTHREKLQRQVDFLNNDTLQDYVAVTHHHVIGYPNGNVCIEEHRTTTEFTYVEFMKDLVGYYHTSTYMYRNIFRGHVPDFLKEDRFRGDSIRTAIHLQASRKKVKVLDYVGSVYYYNTDGIWSGLTNKKQKDRQILLLESLQSIADTSFEKNCYKQRIESCKRNWSTTKGQHSFSQKSVDYYLDELVKCTNTIAFKQADFMFKGLYYSEYIDSLCASLGYVSSLYHPECIQRTVNQNRIAIVLVLLNPTGGGVFREVSELLEIYDDKEILVLLTDTSQEEIDIHLADMMNAYPHATIIAPPANQHNKLAWLGEQFADFAPYKAYFYASHFSPYVQALTQNSLCKNVCLFSFDHGFICGITNPNLDYIIAKRPVDHATLKKYLGNKVRYIPAWSMEPDYSESLKYQPFNDHSALITASGSARFYKFDGNTSNSSYLENVLALLSITRGAHIHFGPVPPEGTDYIREYLENHGLPQDSFTIITWSDNMFNDMLSHHVDIFIEPFPIVSYKMTLQVLSGGIPVLAQESLQRMSQVDFIYESSLKWRTKQDFLDMLTSITAEQLIEHSKKSREYFSTNHSAEVLFPYLREDKDFPLERIVEPIDNGLSEIRDYESIWNDQEEPGLSVAKSRLSLMSIMLGRSKANVPSGAEAKVSGVKEVFKQSLRKIIPLRTSVFAKKNSELMAQIDTLQEQNQYQYQKLLDLEEMIRGYIISRSDL